MERERERGRRERKRTMDDGAEEEEDIVKLGRKRRMKTNASSSAFSLLETDGRRDEMQGARREQRGRDKLVLTLFFLPLILSVMSRLNK